MIQQALICRCARARILPEETISLARQRLEAAGIPCQCVDDLCELSAHKDPRLKTFAQVEAGLVLACQPRAVQWLFAAAQAPLDPSRTKWLALPNPATVEFLQNLVPATALSQPPSPDSSVGAETALQPTGGWHAWFPVIDFDRCTHCLQCLSFCLFGVFGVAPDRRLQVENPAGCKPNCPACARVCPEAAILFPKCSVAAMNGSEIAAGSPEAKKVNISALLGGDLYERLRARNRKTQARFSPERDPQTALAERRQYLAELAKEIPPEVLMSLPSPEEMQQRAEAARQRAQQAATQRKTD